MTRASAPFVLPIDDLFVPCGPDRVWVSLSERAGHLSLVRCADSGYVLRIDPSLEPPADDEGPLGPVAHALRLLPAPHAMEVEVSGLTARPFLAESLQRCVLGALAWATDQTRPEPRAGAELAIDSGSAQGPVDLAALDRVLVLYRDSASRRPAHPSPGAGLIDALHADLSGLPAGPADPSPREQGVNEALEAGGLRAWWSLGDGLCLGVVDPERKPGFDGILGEYELEAVPCCASGVVGLRLEDGP